MTHLDRVLVLLCAMLPGACASTTAYDPMVAGPVPVHAIRTIALTSTSLPKGVPSEAPLRLQFDSALMSALQSAGYKVIPPEQVDPLWHSLSDTAQLYDSRTGTLNTEQQAMIARVMSREVKARFDADAWLFADLATRAARYESGWCNWDGTKQHVETTGSLLKNAFFGLKTSGTMRALSVRVIITDTTGRAVYRNYGGIAALVKVAAGGVQDVDAGDVLADGDRNVNGVRLALQPLVKSLRQDRQH